jgi:hypothetical protein
MENPTGESNAEVLRLDFDRRLMLQFRGSLVTSDAGFASTLRRIGFQRCAKVHVAPLQDAIPFRDLKVSTRIAGLSWFLIASRTSCGLRSEPLPPDPFRHQDSVIGPPALPGTPDPRANRGAVSHHPSGSQSTPAVHLLAPSSSRCGKFRPSPSAARRSRKSPACALGRCFSGLLFG